MKNWKNIRVKLNETIHSAIEVLNREGYRIALVTDDEDVLHGVITDGDIRRGLLQHIPLDASVTTIMNQTPKVAKPDWEPERLLKFMEAHSLLQLPVLNSKKQIIDIHTLHDLLKTPVLENPVFIMAGGFGTRLRPLTNTCPKPMLQVGGKPLLETLVSNFVSQGFKNLYISTHYLPHIIVDHFGNGAKWGANITYVHEEDPLGTGGALGLLPDTLPKLPLIMVNGDVLTNIDFVKLLEFHEDSKGTATMCVKEYQHQIPYGVVEGEDNKIKKMVEKPTKKFFVNAGIYVINTSVIKSVKEKEKIDMPSLLQNQMDKGENIFMFPIHEYWLDVGRIDDFNKAQKDFLNIQME